MHSMPGAGHTCNLHLLTYLLTYTTHMATSFTACGRHSARPWSCHCSETTSTGYMPTRMGAGLIQAVFDGVHCTGHFLAWHRLTSPNFAFPSRRRFNSSAVFVSCSRHSVRSRTRLELGKRAFTVAAIAAWKSP